MKNGMYEEDGKNSWYKDDVLHREDGPAIEYPDGTMKWYANGVRHRLDGPAIERANGSKTWYHQGVVHRIGGPAVIWENGDADWWVDGRKVDIIAIFGYLPSIPLSVEQQMILRLSI